MRFVPRSETSREAVNVHKLGCSFRLFLAALCGTLFLKITTKELSTLLCFLYLFTLAVFLLFWKVQFVLSFKVKETYILTL